MIPFLSVKNSAIKVKVRPQFPANLIGGVGLVVSKTNGIYTINLNYEELQAAALGSAAHDWVAIWDDVSGQFFRIKISDMAVLFNGVTEAPNDGQQYGRQSLGWTPITPPGGVVRYDIAQALSEPQRLQARQNIYAAPLDAMNFNGFQINGSMDISQDNSTNALTAVSGGVVNWSCDVWHLDYNVSAGVTTVQQVTPPGSPAFGTAFLNCTQIKSTTAVTLAAASVVSFGQRIEGVRWAPMSFGNAAATAVTIGFWIYATIAGTATAFLQGGVGNRTYPVNFTINSPNTWEYKTVTFPGDTVGGPSSWPVGGSRGAWVGVCLAAGANNQGAAGSWNADGKVGTSSTTNFFASNNNVVCITGFGIWAGSDAPSALRSPYIMRPPGAELYLVQRYFVGIGTGFVSVVCGCPSGAASVDGVSIFVNTPVVMRGAPGITHPFTDATFTTSGVPPSGQWNLQQPFVATATKTGTASFNASSSPYPGSNFISISGCTFNRQTLMLAATSMGDIKANARVN